MSILLSRRSAVLPLALLLAACSTAPTQQTTGPAGPESNEPDLVAQLRERMAAGKLQHKAKPEVAGNTAATADTSSAPRVVTDPAKVAAARTIAADYARAIALMQDNKDAEALSLFQAMAAKTPQFAGPQLNQAVILLRQDKPVEAEASVRAALKANPSSPYAQNLLGIALRQQGKFADAKAAYEAALALDPNYARAHFNLGVLADLYQQDLPYALDHYEKYQALQAKPDQAVANWIVDLQKRTGVYKPPPKPTPVLPAESAPVDGATATGDAPAAPAPAPADGSAPVESTAPAADPAPAAPPTTVAPATSAPAAAEPAATPTTAKGTSAS